MNQPTSPMKCLIAVVFFLLLSATGSLLAQDTTKSKQSTGQTAAPAKNTAPTSETKDTSPVINKIAVSDPGMPVEKPTSTKRSSSGKSADKKKRNSSGVNPK